MVEKKLGVIIPTFNRKAMLIRVLKALNAQDNNDFQVIIVDDGSSDGTSDAVRNALNSLSYPIVYLAQSNRGPGSARNLGLRSCSNEIVAFIGDDIIVNEAFISGHLKAHREFPEENIAILGYVTWSPEITITPFMRWLENGGPQFKYCTIKDPLNVPWTFLYTSNISFKRRFLLENGLFDQDFPYAAYEDTELGYRLAKYGLRIVYNKRAVGFHYHPTSLYDAMTRMRRVGKSRWIFWEKIGQKSMDSKDRRGQVHRALSEIKFWLFGQIGHIAERRWVTPRVYSYLLDKAQSEVRNG